MENKSNNVLKIIGLIVVGFIILCSIFCIGGSLIFKSSFDGVGESGNKSDTVKTKDLKEEKKDYKKTDDTFENNEFKFKILKINKNYTKEYMFKKNKDYRVVLIDIEIKNVSNKDIYIQQFLAKSNDKMLTQNFSTDDGINTLSKIVPNTTINGTVAFEIPKEAKSMTLIYDYGFINDKKLNFDIDVSL